MPTDTDQILDKLSTFHSEFTEFRGEMKARVTQIEEDAKDARKWENIKLYAILPLTVGLHSLATKIGLLRR